MRIRIKVCLATSHKLPKGRKEPLVTSAVQLDDGSRVAAKVDK